jgi:hypothetical protein
VYICTSPEWGESSIFPTPSTLSGFLVNIKQNSMPNPNRPEWIFGKYQALLELICPTKTTKSGLFGNIKHFYAL